MKILYVSDNRVRGNYGCRATSTALSQLIRRNNEIVGVITGRYTNHELNDLIFYKHFPTWLYPILGKIVKKKSTRHFFFKLQNRINRILSSYYYTGPFDYISLDFDKSISNLLKCLPANPHLQEFNLNNYDFDAMVVNGEGSFIFSTPEWHWREALNIGMLMHWALKLNKKVYFVNAMFSDESTSGRNMQMLSVMDKIFSQCNLVSVREKMSYEYACKFLPNTKAIINPDALFTWYDLINDDHKVKNGKYYIPHCEEKDELYEILDFTKPYICIAGSSFAKINENKQHTVQTYCTLVNELKKSYKGNVFLVEVCEGDYFLRDVSNITNVPLVSIETPLVAAGKILANAQAFISGRYHPAILASLGGTPCVFMGSNSHKTLSLQHLLCYEYIHEFNPIPSTEEIDIMVKMALDYINKGSDFRTKIQQRCKELSQQAGKLSSLLC